MRRNEKLPDLILELLDCDLRKIVEDEGWKRLLSIAEFAPGLDSAVEIYDLEQGKGIEPGRGDYIASLISGLIEVVKRAVKGDELAQLQVEAVHKMIFPEIFNLTRADVEPVAKRDLSHYGHQAQAKARGYQIRRWMSRISFMVEPKRTTARGSIVLGDGEEIELPPVQERMTPETPVNLLPRLICTTEADYELVAEVYEKYRGQTLQSLAIRVFQLELEQLGTTVPHYEDLKQDLKLVAELDSKYSPDSGSWQLMLIHGGNPLPVRTMKGDWEKGR